ncbi:hypothetical protein BTJ40_14115 [Microbulbifer sp. A4B17]|uniref:glycosyltransferase n=1 Tax=Microbulbifer sp. A4B17 TaxID=359370 RepID=UPI000D52A925|nr:glycosyltransferase [Microbulbifer sp. A4B17]AWF81869.1 hypothetical protein BTJ40_14115 [Microbulbifer sp. A4B17]
MKPIIKKIKAKVLEKKDSLRFELAPLFLRRYQDHLNSSPKYFRRLPAASIPTPSFNSKGNITTLAKSRVLHLVHWFELGGAEKFALECADFVKKNGGVSFAISTVPSKNKDKPAFEETCSEVIEFDKIGGKPEFLSFLFEFLRSREITTLHIHHSSLGYYHLPLIRAIFPELKIVDSAHVLEHFTGGYIETSIYYSKYIDTHHVISNSLREYYLKENVAPDNLQLLYLSGTSQPLSSKATKRSGSFKVAFYGRFEWQKQLHVTSAIIKQCHKNKSEGIEFHLTGQGSMEQPFKDSLKGLIKQGYVTFYERNDNKDEVFSDIDLLLINSVNEGLTLTAFEAISRGIPVLSTDVGAQRELLTTEGVVDFLDRNLISKMSKKILSLSDSSLETEKLHSAQLENFLKMQEQSFCETTLGQLYDQ